jgi:catalase
LIANFAGDLGAVKNRQVKTRIVAFTYKADPIYGIRLAKAVDLSLDEVQSIALSLSE